MLVRVGGDRKQKSLPRGCLGDEPEVWRRQLRPRAAPRRRARSSVVGLLLRAERSRKSASTLATKAPFPRAIRGCGQFGADTRRQSKAGALDAAESGQEESLLHLTWCRRELCGVLPGFCLHEHVARPTIADWRTAIRYGSAAAATRRLRGPPDSVSRSSRGRSHSCGAGGRGGRSARAGSPCGRRQNPSRNRASR